MHAPDPRYKIAITVEDASSSRTPTHYHQNVLHFTPLHLPNLPVGRWARAAPCSTRQNACNLHFGHPTQFGVDSISHKVATSFQMKWLSPPSLYIISNEHENYLDVCFSHGILKTFRPMLPLSFSCACSPLQSIFHPALCPLWFGSCILASTPFASCKHSP